ncbi:MAG: hypothetical protein NTV22_04705 [bacterium]|nr:hypothetical protein [bacterium]
MNTKRFDCVRMKNEIQAALLKEFAPLSDAQRQLAMRKHLRRSKSPVAQLWR